MPRIAKIMQGADIYDIEAKYDLGANSSLKVVDAICDISKVPSKELIVMADDSKELVRYSVQRGVWDICSPHSVKDMRKLVSEEEAKIILSKSNSFNIFLLFWYNPWIMNLNLDNIHKVVCLGIGGGDLSYISKFLFYLGIKVEGFDIAVNERIKELERLGVNIHHRNPEGKLPRTNLVIYSDALPDNLLQELKRENENVKFVEVGRIKRFLADAYESNTLTKKQLQAIKKADIFPLYSFKPRGMKLIGVTGTDGKTTVVSMLHHMLLKSGFRPAMISTVGSKIVKSIQILVYMLLLHHLMKYTRVCC